MNRIMELADEYAECVKDYTMLHPLREQAHAALKAEVERVESVPMKYKRMEFNAELQQRIAELEKSNAQLLEALKMMGTPSPAVFLPHEIELWQNAIAAAEVKP